MPTNVPAPNHENRMDKRKPAAGRCNAVLQGRGTSGEDLYCHNYPVTGRDRCKHHGGATPVDRRFDFGPEHFYGRGYARKIPARLVEMLDTFAGDHDLLSLNAEMRLTDARVGELLERLESGEIPHAWALIVDGIRKLRKAVDENKLGDILLSTALLESALELKKTDHQHWAEIQEWIELRRKLADTERRREEALQTYINSKQMITFMGLIQQAIVEEVHDPHILSALTRRIRHLANRPELPSRTQEQLTGQLDEIILNEGDDHGGEGGGSDQRGPGEPPAAAGGRPAEPDGDGFLYDEPGPAGQVGGGEDQTEVPGERGTD